MSAHTGFGARDRWRLRQNRLWILAAALGAATIYTSVSIIHDNSSRHVAANLVRRATAERISAYGSARLTALALETFAPVAIPSNGATPRALLQHQDAAAKCACRDTLPARGFFRVDLATNAVDVAMRPGAASLPSLALVDIARREASRSKSRPNVHLTTNRTLGDAATITYVQYDNENRPRAVFGLVTRPRDIGTTLFADADRATTVVDLGARMVTLDSVSLMVVGEDSVHLFGALDHRGRFYVVVYPHDALEGVGVGFGLTGAQIHPSLLTLVPRQQLWHNGMLMLATILVVAFAVGSGRREMLLARARSDFVAGVSHELRMPLAQILLASETLTTHPASPERERLGLANAIVREARRLIGLVENLLLFSRTGSVDLRVRLARVPVIELFAGVVESVELAADDARQSIDTKVSASLAVSGDRQLLRQALVNLVDNALKYGKPGQRIELSATRVNDDRVQLAVDDEGPGIPKAERDRVFQPYQRLDRDQTSERTGAGLGLAVVRQIVEGCGGRVWLEDSPRGGTRVVLELQPAAPEASVPSVGAPA